MEVITTQKVISEYSYKASDGEVFSSQYDCELHERFLRELDGKLGNITFITVPDLGTCVLAYIYDQASFDKFISELNKHFKFYRPESMYKKAYKEEYQNSYVMAHYDDSGDYEYLDIYKASDMLKDIQLEINERLACIDEINNIINKENIANETN